ncbi:type VI secretion system contractile sheath large subunit [Thalassolituus sp. UBA2590]|uniref:type VI secretion system contractile sheath large subunit n=1 Tax=Thalassolituus sp. UBA2590 TaxID=1947663 RepID=UPI0007CF2380|nr:type VI secretion system contractile sheath large subunit [Thalassolituus sp. UBA2590]KZZ00328.1 type VI secretion protein [Oleibacter sp. HI0075]
MLNDSAGMAVMSENPSPTLSSDEIPLADIYSFLSENDDVEAFRRWVELSSPADTSRLEPCRWLAQQVAFIDELISEQIDAVLHNKRFQALEASWRGLWFLIDAVVNPENTKIRLLDVSWKDLARDMERAPDFDQSGLFHLIYNEEFGTPGGEPFSVLLGDYYVAHRPYEDHRIDDVFTLQGISRAAAAAFCPFVCSAAPQLFGLDDFDNLGLHINVDEIFRSHDYVRWRSMREHDDSRFLALTLPQVLMREPYRDNRRSRRGLRFNESVAGKDNRKYLWGNACFALGTVLIREFSEVGWFSHIRGVPRDHYGGGLVTQFPTPAYRTDSSRAMVKMSTSVTVTDQLERELSDYGMIALCHCFQTPYAVFNNCPSLQIPKVYAKKSATANARISSMLQQILCGSRVAQYIKVIVRDKVGSYTTAESCERFLQNWLDQYTTGRDDLSWEMMARYPLREARVVVDEDPAQPGYYSSLVHLKTHYSVDHLVSELRLTTSLSQIDIGKV